MLAIQDQVVLTRNYRRYIIRDGAEDDNCRRCNAAPETIQDVISGCPSLAPVECKRRHDLELALRHGLLREKGPYYTYAPASVLPSEEVMLHWDRTVLTDRAVRHNRPDLVLVDRKASIARFIAVAIPCTLNLEQTTKEKVTKYIVLSGVVKDQWGMKRVETVPVVISVTGVVMVLTVTQAVA